MIYLSDDYVIKYIDTFGYIFSRSIKEGYTFPYIEKKISQSLIADELEKSNVTTIAFTSFEKIYQDIFPQFDNQDFVYNPYDQYGWIGYIYIHLFLHYQITFELLFIVLPLEEALSLYSLYHEMDYTKVISLFKERVEHSYLDNIMKRKEISTQKLSDSTGIPFSTLNAIRYGVRDISKLESKAFYKISKSLNIKMTSLITNLELELR